MAAPGIEEAGIHSVAPGPLADTTQCMQLKLLGATRKAILEDSHESLLLLDQLHIYTQVRFMSEQLLMRLAERRNDQAHTREHQQLLQELKQIRGRVEQGETHAALEGIRAHQHHVTEHIHEWDHTSLPPD